MYSLSNKNMTVKHVSFNSIFPQTLWSVLISLLSERRIYRQSTMYRQIKWGIQARAGTSNMRGNQFSGFQRVNPNTSCPPVTCWRIHQCLTWNAHMAYYFKNKNRNTTNSMLHTSLSTQDHSKCYPASRLSGQVPIVHVSIPDTSLHTLKTITTWNHVYLPYMSKHVTTYAWAKLSSQSSISLAFLCT